MPAYSVMCLHDMKYLLSLQNNTTGNKTLEYFIQTIFTPCLHLRLPVQREHSQVLWIILVEQFSHALDPSLILLKNACSILFGKLFQKPLMQNNMGNNNLPLFSIILQLKLKISKGECVGCTAVTLNHLLYDAKLYSLSPFGFCEFFGFVVYFFIFGVFFKQNVFPQLSCEVKHLACASHPA